MAFTLKIGTFNCENLFHRAKILNLKDETKSGEYLEKIARLQSLLDKVEYDEATRQEITMLSGQLHGLIDFRAEKPRHTYKNQRRRLQAEDRRSRAEGSLRR